MIDPLRLAKEAFEANDAESLGLLLNKYPQLKEVVNQPIGPFDSPAIIRVRSAAMLDVLLEAGAEINARSRGGGGGFGGLDGIKPELATDAISRGATVTGHAAAALGDLELVKKHLRDDPQAIRMSVSEKWYPKENPRAGGHIYIWTLGQNKTPQMVAREFGHEEVFAFLMERTPEEVRLAQALELGDEKTFGELLAKRPGLVMTLSEDDARKLVDAAQNNN